MSKTTQFFFDLDAKIVEIEMHPKTKSRPGPKVSRKHREKLDLLALLDRRSGSGEEWGRFIYHVFIKVRDWTNGAYTAQCTCSFEYQNGDVFPNNVCDGHETIWDADFESEGEVLIGAKIRTAKDWYYQLPRANLPPEAERELREVCLIAEDFDYDSRGWVGKIVTIEPEYGNTCGCSFKVREYEIEGIPWQIRKGYIRLMTKYADCGNHNNSCTRPTLLKDGQASQTIKQIIARHRVI